MPYAVRQIMRWKDDIGSKVAMKPNTQNASRAMNNAIPVRRRSVFMARWLAHWQPLLVIDKSIPRITCLNGAGREVARRGNKMVGAAGQVSHPTAVIS